MNQNQRPLIRFTGIDGLVTPDQIPSNYDPKRFVPSQQSDDAVGFDIAACRVLDRITRKVIGVFPCTIHPREIVLFGTGFIMAVPEGVDAQIRPRSGLAAKYGVIMANGPGTIDPDYRGECAVALINMGSEPFTVNYGDRIGQIIFSPILIPEFEYVPDKSHLPATRRDSGGFGSTGLGKTEGFGLEATAKKIARIDHYMMENVLSVSKLSNCVRGCPRIDSKVQIDKFGYFVGQARRLGCIIGMGDIIYASGYNQQYPVFSNTR